MICFRRGNSSATGIAVEVFRELIDEEKSLGRWNEMTAAAFAISPFSLDKIRDYNSRMSRWHVNREVTG